MNPLLRARDVGKRLGGLSDQGVINLVHADLLKAVRFKTRGKRFTYRFREEDVMEFILRHLKGGGKGK